MKYILMDSISWYFPSLLYIEERDFPYASHMFLLYFSSYYLSHDFGFYFFIRLFLKKHYYQ